MGTLVGHVAPESGLFGHVAPGFGFFVIGLWHLLNHIKLHALNPKSYTSLPWFPTSKIKFSELFLIIGGCLASISMELFVGPEKHQLFDTDGTIPSNRLHNFEHSSISMTILVYAIFAIIFEKLNPPAKYDFTQLLGAIAFAQELLLFHLHSADHTGVEGQFHWLLQIVIFVSLVTTLLGIAYSKSFLNSFLRSLSILFQGVWLMVMGFMLWTPQLIPKGCFINFEKDHQVVRCHTDKDLERAKSVVNIQFSWYLIGVAVFCMTLYLVMIKFYSQGKVEYQSLRKIIEDQEDDYDDDVEAQSKKLSKMVNESKFLPIGRSSTPIDMER